jgi:hypothetical protein
VGTGNLYDASVSPSVNVTVSKSHGLEHHGGGFFGPPLNFRRIVGVQHAVRRVVWSDARRPVAVKARFGLRRWRGFVCGGRMFTVLFLLLALSRESLQLLSMRAEGRLLVRCERGPRALTIGIEHLQLVARESQFEPTTTECDDQ